LITEVDVECYTYFQLSVKYCIDQITQAMLLIFVVELSWWWLKT